MLPSSFANGANKDQDNGEEQSRKICVGYPELANVRPVEASFCGARRLLGIHRLASLALPIVATAINHLKAMPKPQKRDRDYYEGRLRDEFPSIYADLQAGKFKTVNEAAKAAGLVKPPRAVNALKNAWKKASLAEQREFLAWVRSRTAAKKTPPTVVSKAVVDADSYVLEWAKKRVETIMGKRVINETQVMHELGFKPLDASLWKAIRRSPPSRIRPALATALEEWIRKYQHV
ncbi:hypothetical protein ACFX5Q_11450 [Mesorhizobium sp. IMUNJ 23033]|uniref:hypothetical protein n=1 Tax=Mesorhizobium sp. IMUNJ 23033 TaxID=3378039 RepID=UPI00384DE78C